MSKSDIFRRSWFPKTAFRFFCEFIASGCFFCFIKWSFASFLACRSSPLPCPLSFFFFFSFPQLREKTCWVRLRPNATPLAGYSAQPNEPRREAARRRVDPETSGADKMWGSLVASASEKSASNRERWRGHGLACSSLWLRWEFSSSACWWKESCRERRRRRRRGPVRAPSTSTLSWISECPGLFTALLLSRRRALPCNRPGVWENAERILLLLLLLLL